MNLHNVEFIKSAAKPSDIIRDGLPQFVFSGKSNVGKSSVINKLLGRKQFARVSATPGKTVHINYFLVDKTAYLVDLPGYGYAKVAKTEYARWSKLLSAYFEEPRSIALAVMIVDARHKPTEGDVTMARWFMETHCSFIVLANKIDKVSTSEKERNIAVIRQTLGITDDTEILEFSATKGIGKKEVLMRIVG